MLYFAYGSNMLLSQIRKRLGKPDLTAKTNAVLENSIICFPRFSETHKCGVASFETPANYKLWGVIFEITQDDLTKLDKYENCPGSYNRIEVTVNPMTNEGEAKVITYIANPQTGTFFPNKKYMETIITGAIENELPSTYISFLKTIKTSNQLPSK